MAWVNNRTTLGTANSKTANQTSLVILSGNATSANDVAILVVAVDNNQTTDGDEGAVTSVTDSTGANTWAKAAEFCNGQGAAQAGATCSIWYSQLVTGIPGGGSGSITINFSNSASRDASAATCSVWNFSAGSTVSVQGTGTRADDGVDPGSLDVTTPNAEFLRVRGIAGETNNTTDITTTASWGGNLATDQSTGGGAATNQAVRGEWRVVTGTNAASDPTWTAVDCASVYVAFKENLAASVIWIPPNFNNDVIPALSVFVEYQND